MTKFKDCECGRLITKTSIVDYQCDFCHDKKNKKREARSEHYHELKHKALNTVFGSDVAIDEIEE